MDKILPWVVLGIGGWMLYRAHQLRSKPINVPLKAEPPPGSRPTGRTQRTTNSNRPGDMTERLSYTVREFMEILMPDGSRDWFEIDRTKMT